MEQLKKKYLFLIDLLTSLFSQKALVFLLIGLILVGLGAFVFKMDAFVSGDKVEVLNSVTVGQIAPSEVVVEIAGAVEKPGVYKLAKGSRIDDLLIMSGGLSANSDREWVAKKVNRASILVDGQKYYFYSNNETDYHSIQPSDKEFSGIKLDQSVLGEKANNLSDLVNVNTSSQSEIEKLKGIGPVFAKSIIEHRPYSNLQDLVSKGAISQKVLDKIINDVSLY